MRKLIFGINLTADGCCDHTKGNASEEIHDYWAQQVREADVLVYGRKTYELMVPFWSDLARNHSGEPRSIIEFAQAFDAVNRIVVFSRTLKQPNDGKTTMFREGLGEEILKLKQEEGKDILVGGVDIPSQLIELGLVDEYRFVIHPVIAGEGRRLMEGIVLPEQLQLKLMESRVLGAGHVLIRYVKE